MSQPGAQDFGRTFEKGRFEKGRGELLEMMRRFPHGLDSRLHDDAEVWVGEEGVLGVAVVRHSGDGLTAEALKHGVDVAIVYIDMPRSKIHRGFYRCHVVGKEPRGKMTLYGADGARADEIDATITFRPGTSAAAKCGVGISSHVDPSGRVPTKTVCWSAICSTSGGVSIVTGCVVQVSPGD